MFSFLKYASKKEWFVFIYIMHIIRFYYFMPYVSLHNFLYVIDICYALFFFLCFIKCIHCKVLNNFELATGILYLIFCISVIISIKNGQSIERVLKYSCSVYLQYGFFYFLKLYNIKVDFLWKLLIFLFVGYVFVTICCYLQYPNLWFGGNDEQSLARMKDSIENRGVIRFSLPCKMLIPLFLFYEIQNMRMDLVNKIKILLLFILLLAIGNRFPLAVSLIIAFIMVIVSHKVKFINKLKIGFTMIVLVFFLYYIPLTNKIISSLINVTMNERGSGDENNIRVISATYFFTEFNGSNNEAKIIGNGIANNGFDKYSRKISYLNNVLGYWEGDVGYCELYIYFGILGLLAFFYWCFGFYKINVNFKYIFIKFYFLFLVITMICGGYWFENFYIVNILSYFLIKSNKQLCKQSQ